MKKLVALLVFLFIMAISYDASAHPGRTDANGGHTCRTNCEKWGLKTGEYHYHNGGESSSSESTAEAATETSTSYDTNDKDCEDFSSYDEVVEYWNANGYSATNDPERLDGWGNKVDDGIPCEVPSGYDTSKINGSPEQIAAKQAEQDKQIGEDDGYTAGLEAGYQDKSNDSNPSGSDAYKEAYAEAFDKGWIKGNDQLTEEMKAADEAGYALGKKQDKLEIPSKYASNPSVKKSFEDAFNKGVKKRVEETKKEYSDKGYKDGKKDESNTPKDVDDMYVKAYEEGYQKGQEVLKESYLDQGYEAAFNMLKYEEPTKLDKDKYVQWYKEGFESNQEIEKIAKTAYESGLEGNTYEVPAEYKKAETVYKYHFDHGYEEYEKEQQETKQQIGTGAGVVILAWLGRRFYVARKMVS